jgi:predicted nucleic acid-binding protein
MASNGEIIMGMLLDTGFLYALKDEDDPNHNEAQSLLVKLDWANHAPVVTTDLVISETYTLMVYRSKGNISLLSALDDLFWGAETFFHIIYLGESDLREITQILRKCVTSRRLLSFVDASLIYLSESRKLHEIATFDSHFDGILTRVTA